MIESNFDILAGLTRATHGATPVQTCYLSLSSGERERVIVPNTLADNGLRWYVRAFEQERNRFSDFVLTRLAPGYGGGVE
ncbi:MAG: hypothetical protein PHE55_22720 [Methylococcaceae bacterium]|nr:hypothetical protein [Methylococcaceae bacterium]